MSEINIEEMERRLSNRCQLLYRTYEYLRNNDLSDVSFTSKLLRSPDFEKIQRKVVEEASELQGVLDGTHVHKEPNSDFLLETHELMYWLLVGAVASKFPYAVVRPHRQLIRGFASNTELVQLLSSLEEFAQAVTLNTPMDRTDALTKGLFLIGQACHVRGVRPESVVERDIVEMKQRPYIAFLFEGDPGNGHNTVVG